MTRRRGLVVGVVALIAVVGFLLFRPDTLFTEVQADETLEEAFARTTTTDSRSGDQSPTTSITGSSSTTVEQPSTTTSSLPEGPVQVAAGQFVGIDHTAEGTAAIYEQSGRYVLRFEDDTQIQNGPDLYVWVLPTTSYEGGTPDEYIDLGFLAGTVGGQNYELPAEFDPDVHRTVLIWCLRFAVPFATAPLG